MEEKSNPGAEKAAQMIKSMSKIRYIQVNKRKKDIHCCFEGRKGHNLRLGEGKGNPIFLFAAVAF